MEGFADRTVKIDNDIWVLRIIYNGEDLTNSGEKQRGIIMEEEEREILIIGEDLNARVEKNGDMYTLENRKKIGNRCNRRMSRKMRKVNSY